MPARGSSHGLIDNFYLSQDELLHNSPSRRAGVDADTERSLRVFGCERVQLGVLYLRLPQVVAATGQVLLHRFYCKHSMTQFDVKRVAIASTWLASKLEEAPRKFRDVLAVFARIDSRTDERAPELLDLNSQRFETLKQDVFRIEKSMLRAFGFVTHVEHPHKFVLSLLQILEVSSNLLQEAWNLTNDSLRTTLCVRFKSEVVACGIIFLAARRLQVVLPEKPDGCWWDLCCVSKDDVLEVASEIHALYSMPRPVYVPLGHAATAPGSSAPRLSAPAAAAPSPAAAVAADSPAGTAFAVAVAAGDRPQQQQLPNGVDASTERRHASGPADVRETSGGGSGGDDSKGQAASGPEKAKDSSGLSRPRSRSRSAEEVRLAEHRRRSRSAEREHAREPQPAPRSRDREAERSQRPSSNGHRDDRSYRDDRHSRERDRDRGRDRDRERGGPHSRSERPSGRDSGDAAHSPPPAGDRDVARDSAPERERDRDRDSRRREEAGQPRDRDQDRGEHERKRDRPGPSDSDPERKRSRVSQPGERPSSRLSGRATPLSRTPSPLPPPPLASGSAESRPGRSAQDAMRDSRQDSRLTRPRPSIAERIPVKDRLTERPPSSTR